MIHEIDSSVDLCGPDGRLNPSAVGWSRHPLHRANLSGRGRAKRWEYWAITHGDLVFAVTVSDLDYAALHAVYVLDDDGHETTHSALVPFARIDLPDRCSAGPVRVRTRRLDIDLIPDAEGIDISASAPGLDAAFRVDRPIGHESLGVVVPWGDTRFQYTVKENTLPATGEVRLADRTLAFGPGAWATLDHGRGKWPHAITWNWGSGSGEVDGHVVGIQVGGAWTDRTGSTENALTLDGRVHYIGNDLTWEYSPTDWMAPWHIHDPVGGRVDLTFAPRHVRAESTNLGLLSNATLQAFGSWAGRMVTEDGALIRCDGIRGWAEEVRNRW